MTRFVRTSLSLLVAYAIVLGGVLGPILGQGFDPASHICAFGPDRTSSGQAPDVPQTQATRDCCPGICGSHPALSAPVAGLDDRVFYSEAILLRLEARPVSAVFAQRPSARAPPAG